MTAHGVTISKIGKKIEVTEVKVLLKYDLF